MLDFDWCLKPIIVWIRVMMGIDLKVSRFSNSHENDSWSLLTRCHGFFVLACVISVNILSLVFMFGAVSVANFKEAGITVSPSNVLVIYITAFNNSFANVGVFLVFYISVLGGKWKSLRLILEKTEFYLTRSNREFYLRCRKFVMFGMFVILAVLTLFSYCTNIAD